MRIKKRLTISVVWRHESPERFHCDSKLRVDEVVAGAVNRPVWGR